MDKKKLLWFGDIGRNNSFSRISEEILFYFNKWYDIYILAPPKNQIKKVIEISNENIYHIGDSTNEFSWNEFNRMIKNNSIPENVKQMQYSLMQLIYICHSKKIDYLFIIGGCNICEWFMSMINEIKTKSWKTIVYTPFDYIPSEECIKNILKADKLITTNPLVLDNIEWVGHGISKSIINIPRKKAVKEINKFFSNKKIVKESDIIILNANNYTERKNIIQTVKVFNKLYKNYGKNLKLWLHTDTTSEKFKKEILPNVIKEKVIITQNNVPDEILNYIYNVCQIGLQTSTGEGWSLTNVEHEKTGAIQVVPNFLACKFNFKKSGILIPVNEIKDSKNNCISCTMKTEDIVEKIKKLIVCKNFLPRYNDNKRDSWEDCANKLNNLLQFY